MASRFAAGESVVELAVDYGVSQASIVEAIRFVLDVKGPSLASNAARARIARILPETRRR